MIGSIIVTNVNKRSLPAPHSPHYAKRARSVCPVLALTAQKECKGAIQEWASFKRKVIALSLSSGFEVINN